MGIAEGGRLKAGALSHGGEFDVLESRHRFESGALGFRKGETAAEVGGLGLAEAPGESGRVGGSGSGGVQLAEAGEGTCLGRVEAEGGVDGGEGAVVVERAEGFLRGFLCEDAGELVMETRAADGLEVREVAFDPGERAGLDGEFEAGGVADSTEDAGGVVLEGAIVEGADEASVEVGEAAGGVEDLAALGAVEAEGEGVDGEVAAEEVFAD